MTEQIGTPVVIQVRPVDEVCEYAGHEWTDAGGGLVICVVCQREEFRDEVIEPEGREPA